MILWMDYLLTWWQVRCRVAAKGQKAIFFVSKIHLESVNYSLLICFICYVDTASKANNNVSLCLQGVNFQVRSLFSTHNFKWMIFFKELKKKKKLNPRVRAYSLFFIRHHDLILHMLHDVTILDSPWGANERLAKARRGQMVTLSADSLEALAQKSNRLQWISAADSAVKMTFMCWLAINSVASRLMNMQKDFCLAPLPRCTSTWATRCR